MPEKKKKKKSEGFHSSAGLIRYYDAEEESAFKIDPKIVVCLCIVAVIVVEIIRFFFPL